MNKFYEIVGIDTVMHTKSDYFGMNADDLIDISKEQIIKYNKYKKDRKKEN